MWTITTRKTVFSRDGHMVWAGQDSDYSPTYVLASYGLSDSWSNNGPVTSGVHDHGPVPQIAQETWLQFMVIWDRRVKELFLRLIPSGENVQIMGFMIALHGISGFLGRHDRQLFLYPVEIERWSMDDLSIYNEDWDEKDAHGLSYPEICWQRWHNLVEVMDKDAKSDPIIDFDAVYLRFIALSPNDPGKSDPEAVKRMARWRMSNGDLFWVQGHVAPDNSARFSIARTSSDGKVEIQPDPRAATIPGPRATPPLQFDTGHQMVYHC